MQKNKRLILKHIKDYCLVTLGLFFYTSGWVLFLLPKKIMGGAVSGIGALLNYATRAEDGTGGISVASVFLTLNVILIAFGAKHLGKSFTIKTTFATIVTTIFFAILPKVYPAEMISSLSANNELICAIMGGGLCGLGIGVSMNYGGSTGGTDIIALILNKYRNIGPGRVILYIDIVIIACSYFVFKDVTQLLYGYVMIGVVGYVVDWVISGSKQSFQIFVFSKKYPEIADRITKEFGRGVTALESKGWYTQESGTVLMIIARKYESHDIFYLIKEEDPLAFISVSNASAVYGQGFDQMKNKSKNTSKDPQALISANNTSVVSGQDLDQNKNKNI